MAIPDGDRDQLLDWSHAIVRLFDYNATPEEGDAADRAVEEFVAYLRPIVRERRTRPGDDLISHMTQVDVDGDRLDEDDIVATSILTLNAGHEATVHAIGNGVLALARQPDAYAALHADPTLASSAVEEILRFDTPLQMFERWVLEDIDWAGHRLARGTKVGLLFGAANRDPEAFDDPDRLDVARNDRTHVSFGGGIHLCVGAPLARVELEEAFGALARRVSSLRLEADDLDYLPSLVFRGVSELPVSLTSA
jgi:cytochrome P450